MKQKLSYFITVNQTKSRMLSYFVDFFFLKTGLDGDSQRGYVASAGVGAEGGNE